jgi:DNA-3-methyladenine glycosylase I
MEQLNNLVRCSWCSDDPDYIKYHDQQWGVPLHDDQQLFELLTLEGAQAGLSWLTILKRIEGYKKAFYKFNIKKVANLSTNDLEKIMNDPGIIRNRLKILSVIKNANAILDIQKTHISFNNYLWQYIDNKTLNNKQTKKAKEISELMSKDLKKRGMNFVGPTICYSFIQANGMFNDHSTNCFRHKQLN